MGGKVLWTLNFMIFPTLWHKQAGLWPAEKPLMYTLHASGGSKMLRASAEAAADEAKLLA